MGERANVVVVEDNFKVCLYTHWGAYELPVILRAAMIRGRDRWMQASYLTRIIFSEMIKDRLLALTGFGISSELEDGEDMVILVNVTDQTVQLGNRTVTFDEFVNSSIGWNGKMDKNINNEPQDV